MIDPFSAVLSTPEADRSDAFGTAPLDGWLDKAALERLADDTAIDLMPQLVDIFVSELRGQAAMIEAAAKAVDLSSLARESHVMKSSAGTFGLPRATRLAEQLNAASKANDADEALVVAARLLATIDPSIQALLQTYGLEGQIEAHGAAHGGT
ncbi:MAG: Hpt domain-containing protein [Gammaproteobacteria bacterium]|nr:Hpt domain-containing protein [Gammaproteobacteria bacterium]